MIKDVSIPEFFPKVERSQDNGQSQRSKSQEVSEQNKGSAGEASTRSFSAALKSTQSNERTDRSEDKYQKRNDVYDGSQPQKHDSIEKQVARRGLDAKSKNDLASEGSQADDFVMPGILPSTFSVPKRGVDETLALNEQLPQLAEQQDVLSREAVSEFVADMQSQFGITPEQIMVAFSQLHPQILAGPASESTQAFVNELPLSDGQRSQAAALYSEMLQKSGENVLAEQMTGSAQATLGTEVLTKDQYEKNALDQSLRELNNKFFQNGKFDQQDQSKVSVAGMTAASGTLAMNQPTSSSQISEAGSTLGSFAQSADATTHSSGKVENSAASVASFFASGMTSALNSGENQSASSNGGESDWSSQQQASLSQVSQDKMQPQFMAAGALTPEVAKVKSTSVSPEAKETKGLKGDELLNALHTSLGHGMTSAKLADGAAVTQGAMFSSQVTPGSEARDGNIQQLINKAQVMIKQGGGEMKIEMSPEGMGQVNLKVAVENGQVNIQMVAHNKETKKMIEEGLSELKASLATHKLQVDNLKVDLSDSISKQMQEQLKDHQQNQAREFAQSFLSNMRDERQAFRQGFFDNSSGFRKYKKHSEREGGVPQPTEVASSSKKRQTDRRLDMVA